MDVLQQIQDDEYYFPYHYVTQFENYFTQTFYDSWGINYAGTIEFLLEKLRNENFNSLVDIGCGDGRLTYEIQKLYRDKQIVGIDYSERSIQLAKSMNPIGDYRQLNIIDAPSEKKFDASVLMEVFEHIKPEEAEKFIMGIATLLISNGILYVTVPHINKPVEYKHYRHFSVQSLTDCFQNYFNVIEVIPFEKGKKRKKLMDFLLGNHWFILNNRKARTFIYNYYKKHLFFCSEKKCNRIFVKFQLK